MINTVLDEISENKLGIVSSLILMQYLIML